MPFKARRVERSPKLDTGTLFRRLAAGFAGVLCLAVAAECLAGPVKTSKFPWINTWAVEYYGADGATLQKDAANFDLHLSPHNITGIKSLSPYSQAVMYHIWREQYVNEEPGAVKERKKVDLWTAANGKDKETFYCHYGRDLTIKSYNILAGKDEIIMVPGWDNSNDLNGDGRRDWPSDYGFSTGVGSGYLTDSTKNWNANQWANATLVDRTGQIYRVTGNTSNRLTLASGAPASGRYGLSASGSPNVFATARTKAESRVKTYIWQEYAYAMNIGNTDYQNYRAYDAKKLIVDGDTSWDTDANTLWDGFMIDNTQPEFPWSEVVDGTEVILEYPDKSRWAGDQTALFQVVRNALGPNKYLWGNTGSYDYTSIADAGGGQHQEQYVAITNEHGPVQWDYWKQQSDKGVYSLVLPSWDCWPDQSERERMHYLAFHYMGQQPYIYLGFRGFGYTETYKWDWTPYDWLTAAEVNVGTAVDGMYSLAASGTDPTGQPYKIFKRQYSNALIICRPKYSWEMQNYGDNTAVTFTLPSYTTSSGQSNLYKPLKSDGTFGAAVSKVSLRCSESYILFPDGAATPPVSGDTTAPRISGVTVTETTSDSATLSFSASEPVTASVEYGTGTAYGSVANCSGQSTSHTVSLTSLQPDTVYHFRVKCADASGNQAVSSDYTFTTVANSTANPLQGSFIKEWLLLGPFNDPNPLVGSTDFIGETTVKPSSGRVSSGKTWIKHKSTTDLIDLDQTLVDDSYKAAYAHIYVNSPETKSYRLLLGSDDGIKVWVNGTLVHTNVISRSAAPDEDDVQINLNKGWNTLLLKITQEEGAWGFYARIADTTREDSTGLTYQVDEPAATDTTKPVISGVKTKALSQTRVVISWVTNEAASSEVSYGKTTAYGSKASDASLVTEHSVTLTSLTPACVYNYRVKSADAAGNVSTSANLTFTTPGPAPYIRRWLVIGPFSNKSRSGFSKDYIGEAAVSPTSGAVASGRAWTVHSSTTDLIDFNGIYRPNDNVVAYAHTYVYSPIARNCQLRTGSDDGIKAWVNGKLVLSKRVDRSAGKDAEITPIRLNAGWNKILIKVDEITGKWGFYARISDASGNIVPWLQYRLNKP